MIMILWLYNFNILSNMYKNHSQKLIRNLFGYVYYYCTIIFIVFIFVPVSWWMKWHNGSIRFVWEEKDDTSWTRPQVLEYSIRLMNNLGIIEASSTLITLDNGIEGYLHTIYNISFASQKSIKLSPHHSLNPIQMPWTALSKLIGIENLNTLLVQKNMSMIIMCLNIWFPHFIQI